MTAVRADAEMEVATMHDSGEAAAVDAEDGHAFDLVPVVGSEASVDWSFSATTKTTTCTRIQPVRL